MASLLCLSLSTTSSFHFKSIRAEQHTLSWQVANEQRFGQFFIQRKRTHTWVSFKVMNCKGEKGVVGYALPVMLQKGENHLRIKYLDLAGRSHYSPEVSMWIE